MTADISHTAPQLDSILAEAVRRIRQDFAPAHIVLFGSRARGTARGDSDYDLLVVLPGPVDWRTAGAIYGVLRGLDASFDILTESLGDWQRLSQLALAFEHRIAIEGRELLGDGR
jgi:predicted nucleotidyltransferase